MIDGKINLQQDGTGEMVGAGAGRWNARQVERSRCPDCMHVEVVVHRT